jgi:WD40 repeat protein/serine/threonine protein kinase
VDPQRFQKLRALVEAALDRGESERAAFVDRACDGDTELAREARRLLAHERGGANDMEPREHDLVRALADASAPAVAFPRRIGAYRVERAIGSGGMGTVLLAVREGDFTQRVAIKLIRAGSGDEDLLRRFRTERRVLASLEHPGIARLIDGGQTDEGSPYLVMEYVEGEPIDRWCARRSLGVDERIRLALRVCEVVQYAHQKLVVHRDLKPSNVLVTEDGRPKLLDFGIAKVLAARDGEASFDATATGRRAFTPRYASPEQIRGGLVTAASDVYSLGVVLYELLTGARPYEIATDDPTEAARVVCEAMPPPPSVAVTTRGARERALEPRADLSPPRLRRRLAGDLDNILLTALRKEPERRYASVAELADDLRRHLAHEPVRARPDTLRYRAGKFARRHHRGLAAAATAFASLATALAVSLAQQRRAEEAAREEARHRAIAEAKTQEAEREREQSEWRSYVANVAAAEAAIRADDVADARNRLLAAPQRFRNWEWRHLWRRLDRSRLSFNAHGIVRSLAFSPDERSLASCGQDRSVRLWDLGRGELSEVVATERGLPMCVAYDADGARLAWCVVDGPVRVLDVATGEVRDVPVPRPRSAYSVAFVPGSRLVLCGGRGGAVDVRDPDTGALVRSLAGHARDVGSVAVDATGRRAAAAAGDGSVRVWRLDDGVELARFEGDPGWARSIAFDRAGGRIAGGSRDGVVRVWDAATGSEIADLHGHTGIVEGVAFLAGDRLASSSWDRTVRLWDVERGLELAVLRGHGGNLACVAASASGARIASGENGGDIRVWDARANDVVTVPNDAWGGRLTFVRGGLLLACRTTTSVALVDPATGEVEDELAGNLTESDSSIAVACGDVLAVPTANNRCIDVWRLAEAPEHVASLPSERGFSHVELSASGRWLVAGTDDGQLHVWSLPWTTRAASVASPIGEVRRAARHPCAERVAACSSTGEVALVTLPDLEIAAHRQLGAKQVWDLAFSPDGRLLAAACFDSTVRVLDADTLAEIAVLRGHGRAVECVAFSPDGSRLASGATDYAIKLWDTERFEEVATLHGHGFTVRSVAFSPDGAYLASKASDGTVRVWDAGR